MRLVNRFGKKGHGRGQFNMPCGVAVTKTGKQRILKCIIAVVNKFID